MTPVAGGTVRGPAAAMTDPEIRGFISSAAATTAAPAGSAGGSSSGSSGSSSSSSSSGRITRAAAVIPVGSTEQHGPHLPVSTDTEIALEVARMVAEKNGYLLLPAVPYGVSHEHAPLFNLSLDGQALRGALSGLCTSAHSNGINDVVVINGHHGNMRALDALTGPGGPGRSDSLTSIHVFHYWRHMDGELGHAGFAETSMMLAISADLVRMDLAQRGLVTDGMPAEAVREISELAARSFPEATGNGVWGDPFGATAEAGRRMLEEAAAAIAGACRERLGGGTGGRRQQRQQRAQSPPGDRLPPKNLGGR